MADATFSIAIQAVNQATAALNDARVDLRKVADEAEASSKRAAEAIEKYGEAGGNAERSLRGVSDITTFLGEQAGISLGPLQEMSAAFADLGGGIEGALDGGPKMIAFLKELPGSLAGAIAGAWAHVTALYAEATAFIVANAPILLLVAGLAALGAAIFLIVDNWDTVVAGFTWVKDNVPGVGAVVDGLTAAFQAVVDFLTGAWATAKDLVTGPLNAAVSWITGTWGTVTGAATGPISAVVDWLKDHWELVLIGILTGPLGLAIAWVVENWGAITDAISGALQAVVDWLNGAWQAVTEAVTGALQAVLDWAGWAWSAITGFLTGPVSDAKDAILGFFNDMIGGITDLGGAIWSAGQTVMTALYQGITELWNGTIAPWFSGLGGVILGALGDLGSLLFGAGEALVEGLFDGLKSMWNSVKDQVMDIIDPRNWDIPGLSPLMDAMTHAGAIAGGQFAEGLGAGLGAVPGTVSGALASVADDHAGMYLASTPQGDIWMPGTESGGQFPMNGMANKPKPSQQHRPYDRTSADFIQQQLDARRGDVHVHVHLNDGAIIDDIGGFAAKLQRHMARSFA